MICPQNSSEQRKLGKEGGEGARQRVQFFSREESQNEELGPSIPWESLVSDSLGLQKG